MPLFSSEKIVTAKLTGQFDGGPAGITVLSTVAVWNEAAAAVLVLTDLEIY